MIDDPRFSEVRDYGLSLPAKVVRCDICRRVIDAFTLRPRWAKALAAGMYSAVTCWQCKEAKEPGSTKEKR